MKNATIKLGNRSNGHGFTLIELLVVVAIIALLAALLLPALRGARDRGKSISCLNNMRQLGYAYQLYFPDYNESFPTFGTSGYTGYTTLGRYFGNSKRVLQCPSDPYREASPISFAMNEALIESPYTGNNCAPTAPPETAVKLSLIKSPSKVVVLREFHTTSPITISCGAVHLLDSWMFHLMFHFPINLLTPEDVGNSTYWKAHVGGSNMTLADGSARWFKSLQPGSASTLALTLYDISTQPDY